MGSGDNFQSFPNRLTASMQIVEGDQNRLHLKPFHFHYSNFSSCPTTPIHFISTHSSPLYSTLVQTQSSLIHSGFFPVSEYSDAITVHVVNYPVYKASRSNRNKTSRTLHITYIFANFQPSLQSSQTLKTPLESKWICL